MKEKIFKACLHMIEKEGWKAFSFAKVSEETGIPLHILHKHFSSTTDVMIYLFHKVDQEVLKKGVSLKDVSPKDALFDILMLRFEVAQPYKSVLKSFWQESLMTPEEIPSLLCQGSSSMGWMLEAAGLHSQGLKGVLKTQGLLILYLLTLQTWLGDESPDLSKTMVFLDKGLTRLEKLAPFLNVF